MFEPSATSQLTESHNPQIPGIWVILMSCLWLTIVLTKNSIWVLSPRFHQQSYKICVAQNVHIYEGYNVIIKLKARGIPEIQTSLCSQCVLPIVQIQEMLF